ncbi:hypothetical protein [Acinetobacter sp. CFCC 11171]|uniref:hypothetical protein n=1 Tax=Acinetobacter sp. CFCC 11171 TaxID=1775558 RepID=UPI000DCFF740|nr:hypothetical protein [Acinetobacter sp. CFCC 11171]
MNFGKSITLLASMIAITFLFACTNSSSTSDDSSVQHATEEASQAADLAKLETTHSDSTSDQSVEQEEIPFKVNSQEEYNKETHHIIQLVQDKLSTIYEQDADTKYRIMCLELPMMAYSLKSFADANPEYSDPKVSFEAVVTSVETTQQDIVGSCN